MLNLYTKSGDKGETSLYSGELVFKDSARVEAYGTIDEFGAALGMARALCHHPDVKVTLYELQKLLAKIMAEVASLKGVTSPLTPEDVGNVEQIMDNFTSGLAPLTHFLISGDNVGSAALDVARTVARRAERRLWSLHRQEPINEQVLILMNRFSDLCFILCRVEIECKG